MDTLPRMLAHVNRLLMVLLLVVACGGALWVWWSARSSGARVRIGDTVFRVVVARTDEERVRGLSGRRTLARGEGMLFVFPTEGTHAIWMKDMRFSIDLIWIRDGAVVGTTERLPVPAPGTTDLPVFTPPESVTHVLEVPAGTTVEQGIRTGQPATITFDES